MKLIECYVDNFGKLSSYSQSFSDGFNLVIGKNGCGKTTLSVFIKSMLYGIDSKKQKGEETDRKRYLPWQGGRYGGSLTFENEKKQYRIERSFGQRPSEDTFAIYELATGSLSSDFTENVGEELFGVDADGFERTVFLSEKKFAVNGNNPTVAAKLSNLAGVDGDMGSYDNAIELLEKREKYYRHRRGKGGLIGDIVREISELDARILELERKKDDYREVEGQLTQIVSAIEEAEAKRALLEKKRLSLAYEDEYRAKLFAAKDIRERLIAQSAFFSEHLPSSEEIRINEKKHNQALYLKQIIESTPLPKSNPKNADIEKADEYLLALDKSKNRKNANKSYYFYPFLSIIISIAAILCGLFVNTALYAISFLTLPFIYLTAKGFRMIFPTKEEKEIKENAIAFLRQKSEKEVSDQDLYTALNELRTRLSVQKAESERILSVIERNYEQLKILTDEYTEFLKKFPTESEDCFGEIRERLSAYQALKRQAEEAENSAKLYALQKGLNPMLIDASEKESESADTNINALTEEVKRLSDARYSLQTKLLSLFEIISTEDVLREERLELADRLSKAEGEHTVTLKAAEHLKAAKERLTAKYLGKMRTAFNSYVESITEENASAFALDTDFSLNKTEKGLTNKILAYSLGTQEIYSLITRLALVDALYENNKPFIILDDPFCHFDDKRCRAALKAIEKISVDKQIIYLTCSDSRTPK